MAGRAVRQWEGGAPVDTNFQHGASPISACPPLPPSPVLPPVDSLPPCCSPEALQGIEARLAALEAQAWARDQNAIGEGHAFQNRAEDEVSAAMDAAASSSSDPVVVERGPAAAVAGPLVRNCAASRAGYPGRFQVTHLVVPSSLQPRGAEPRAFCRWAFGSCPTLSFDGGLADTEICDRCLPTLAKRLARRRAARARAVSLEIAEEVNRDLAGEG